MKLLIDDIKLDLLLEKKKQYIGNTVTWDSVLSACSFLISVFFASYKKVLFIPGLALKTVFLVLGIGFTVKAIWDIAKSKKNSYNYNDLLTDINKLNEITHNHSIIAIRDEFDKYPNRFLVYDDINWGCMLFPNYKDNANNESYISDHISREFKINKEHIKIEYKGQNISEKVSGRDNKKKVYLHRLFLVTIDEFPEYMKEKDFECGSRNYHWKSIVDLERDDDSMEKNDDIISFVKNYV